MEESILELLGKVTVVDLIWSVLLLVAVVGVFLSQKKRIVKFLNKWRKTKNEEEDFRQLVYEMRDTVKELAQTVQTFQDNRVHDREDSRRIQREIYQAIDAQADGIRELKEINLQRQIMDSKTKRAEIKRSIERMYAECHPARTCTDMQFEVLKELIEEYEEHGGVNSFVHTTVEPEMLTWDRIKTIGKN